MPQRSLRLVEMQLTVRRAPDETLATEPANTERSADSAAMQEYDARRCHLCQCRHPSFGFGPPLQTGGRVLWSCLAHRDAVERLIRGVVVHVAAAQRRLL